MTVAEMIMKANQERQALIEKLIAEDDSFDYSIKPRETLGYKPTPSRPVVYSYGSSGRIVSR